jgi:nitrite reductase (NADH) small subunit
MSEALDLGPVDRIPPGEGRTFELRGRRIAVFRTRAGQVYATQASCPHRGGPLADGLVGEQCVVCPLHGYKFDLASGAPIGHACGGVTTYPVSVGDDGRIRLHLSILQEAS